MAYSSWQHCLVTALVIPACLITNRTSGQETRSVTVQDAIQMTRWANRTYTLGGPSSPVAVFSPDQSRFAVVVAKGNLERDTVDYSLLLFQTSDALRSPKPVVLLTMSSSSNREGIQNVRWLRDGNSLAFLGENPGETPNVYVMETKSGRLRKLTHSVTPVVAYDISDDGQEIVYERSPAAMPILNSEETKRNGLVITSQWPDDLLAADCGSWQRAWSAGNELFLERQGRPTTRVQSDDFLTEYEPLSLSPDGRYALLGVYVKDIPPSWAEYQDKLLHPYLVERRKLGSHSRLTRYMLLDTTDGDLRPLLDTPKPWINAGFAWARDGRSVALSGSYLPLDVTDAVERETRKTRAFVVEVKVPTREITKITDRPLKVAAWDHSTDKLLLESEDSSKRVSRTAYRRTASSWVEVPATADDMGTHTPLNVTLAEDINTPPKIFVSSVRTEQKSLLLDLNPQFRSLQFGRVEAVSWKATDGHRVLGGLYLPPNFKYGKKYPLVIQTHGFKKDRFWIDGPWSSAFAAQPLAAHDIVVLQVGYSEDPSEDEALSNTTQEGPRHMAAYEGAIEYLDGRGLIDRSRVGIIGFSRTAFRVAYTLTHSRYQFAAATLADGFDGGYFNYVLWGGADSVGVNGGAPFGASLASWLTNSPGFNLDKVQAAMRVEYYGMGSFLGGWQWFSGLSMLEKPVDFIWLPNGTHILVKPWERLVSQGGNVDWFDFWLSGHEDPDPAKGEQYKRWRELRKLQDTNSTAHHPN